MLSGRYEIGELIGRGGMAEVYIGRDNRLDRTVAIKMLRSDLARDQSFHTRFRREAQSAASLNHPAIVSVYDTGDETTTAVDGSQVDIDRKSTRLNSSHVSISYAVFCLKKKKKKYIQFIDRYKDTRQRESIT